MLKNCLLASMVPYLLYFSNISDRLENNDTDCRRLEKDVNILFQTLGPNLRNKYSNESH